MLKHYIKAAALLAAGMFMAGAASAQLVNCNVFLQGKYVEVGVNWNGAYGTSTAAPSGYHTNAQTGNILYNSPACGDSACSDSTRLGFVADPAMDGWDVGTPPFFGDYFIPGVPQEGWSIMADGIQGNAWNTDDQSTADTSAFHYSYALDSTTITFVYDSVTGLYDSVRTPVYSLVTAYPVPGGNVSYSNSAGVSIGTWQGSFDSIAITQVTTLDTGDLFFSVQVTMTNLASTPRNNVYYMRTVDPDNDEPESGSYVTRNIIQNKLPNASNLSVVSAAGSVYSQAFLALGTTDLRAKAFIIKSGLIPTMGTINNIFAEDTTHYIYGQGDSLTADVGIGLMFNIGHLASADTIGATDSAARGTAASTHPNRSVINYFYSFRDPNPTEVKNVAKINMKLYPNPATSEVNITNMAATDHVRLSDMTGRAAGSNWSVAHDGTNTFSTAGLAPGMYIIQVSDANGNPKFKAPLQKL